jgi:precorrin-8X/cobalt-precorrin-8 methylmutase
MESILLIGHGSPKKDANTIESIAAMLHRTIHPGCGDDCIQVAYLQFVKPDIAGGIRKCVERGAKRVIVHPYFLYAGMHVTKDIPGMIKDAEALYQDVEFVYTEPLGIHEKLVQVVTERIKSAKGLAPEEIEKRSFEILTEEADLSGIPKDCLPIVQRVIHATADFEFKNSLVFHPDAVKTGLAAIKAGKDILTDIEMVRTGIIKRWLEPWGGKVICNLNQMSGVGSQEPTKTRSERGIETALREKNNIGIIAIGNAPTALIKTIDLLANSGLKARNSELLVIGVPVGFVKALESKALLAAQKFPFITNLDRKGGTPVAVAIVNALLKMAKGGDT